MPERSEVFSGIWDKEANDQPNLTEIFKRISPMHVLVLESLLATKFWLKSSKQFSPGGNFCICGSILKIPFSSESFVYAEYLE